MLEGHEILPITLSGTMIDLKPKHLETVRDLLASHVPECEVRAFGSRVNGMAKSYSDLDLVVIGTANLDRNRLELLREAFMDSELPFRVDVLDWNVIPESFKRIISRRDEVIQGVRAASLQKG